MPLKYLAPEGGSLQQFGDTLTMIVAIGHGYIYLAYLVVAFLVSRRARWSIPFTLLVLAAGLVPILIFWVEREVSGRLRAQFPELDRTQAPAEV
jgi:integral membrane protein